jgi:hypothetical protein
VLLLLREQDVGERPALGGVGAFRSARVGFAAARPLAGDQVAVGLGDGKRGRGLRRIGVNPRG